MKEEIEILIAKYFVNQITEVEVDQLKKWLGQGNNEQIYKEYIDANYAVESSKKQTYSETDYNKLKHLLQEHKNQNNTLKSILEYVAVFLVLLIGGYTFYYFNNAKPSLDVASVIKDEEVTLSLGKGIIRKIDVKRETELLSAKGNLLGVQVGSELIYNKKQEKIQEKVNVKNTLYVPFGKFFKVTLSDGTQVHLNAGSSLTYPEVFADSLPRRVELVGEAYFVVSKDVKRPFIVNSKNLDIKVLGTQFNFSAYPNDDTNYVVLVEGSLAVKRVPTSKKDYVKSMLVKPNQKALLNLKGRDNIKIADVSVGKYISWKAGELYFENEPFEDILVKMKRHFNVSIKNKNTSLSKVRFTGRFNKENILEVLNTFKLHTAFNFKIKNETIIIE